MHTHRTSRSRRQNLFSRTQHTPIYIHTRRERTKQEANVARTSPKTAKRTCTAKQKRVCTRLALSPSHSLAIVTSERARAIELHILAFSLYVRHLCYRPLLRSDRISLSLALSPRDIYPRLPSAREHAILHSAKISARLRAPRASGNAHANSHLSPLIRRFTHHVHTIACVCVRERAQDDNCPRGGHRHEIVRFEIIGRFGEWCTSAKRSGGGSFCF